MHSEKPILKTEESLFVLAYRFMDFINLKNSTIIPYYYMADTNLMKKVLEEIKAEEDLKKKKKRKLFTLRKEKRIQYYSGWHKNDKPVDEIKGEVQKKL